MQISEDIFLIGVEIRLLGSLYFDGSLQNLISGFVSECLLGDTNQKHIFACCLILYSF